MFEVNPKHQIPLKEQNTNQNQLIIQKEMGTANKRMYVYTTILKILREKNLA